MSKLFEPCFIGTMELKNRFIRSATWEGMATDEGEVTDGLIGIYQALARHGVGLILTGYAFVSKRGKAIPRMLGVHDDRLIPGLKRLTRAVHSENGKVAIQIAHGGSQRMGFDPGFPTEAPSSVKERATGNEPVEMSANGITQLIEDFAFAAQRGVLAGFDAVEIHAAHGYLLSQFLSPYSNRRADKYGGSLKNRARVLFEVYEAIRSEVGDDYPVMVKINSSDFDNDKGLSIEDSAWVASTLSKMGIDAMELSGGIPASGELSPIREKINNYEKEAYFRGYAKELRPSLKCPLILVGGLRSIEVIEEVLEQGTADLFSLSRPLISEPGLIQRWRGGDRKPARCISCNKCLGAAFKEARLYCVSFANKDKKKQEGSVTPEP